MPNWFVQSLRLTVFPFAPIEPGQVAWWEEIIGQPPQDIFTKPREGKAHAEGVWRNAVLNLEIEPLRVDWHVQINPATQEEREGLPVIGRFEDLIQEFYDLTSGWLSSLGPVQRIAFGAQLLEPANDKVDGYRKLGGYLPDVKIDAERSREFLYRINRQRNSSSGIDGLVINRLSTWAVLIFRQFALEMSPESGGRAIPVGTEPLSACRVELDINSSADFRGEITGDALPGLFGELIELAKEITEKGDIP